MNQRNPGNSAASPGFRLAGFPKEFERNFWESFDKRYYSILLACFIVSYGFAFYAAFQDWTLTDTQREKIKKNIIRQYVTDVVPPTLEEDQSFVQANDGSASREEEQPKDQIDERGKERTNESEAQQKQRVRGSRESAAQRARQMDQQASQVGLLGIASSGSASGSGNVAYTDVLQDGGSGGVNDFGELVNNSSGIAVATESSQRSELGGGAGRRSDGTGTGIDDLLSSGSVSSGSSIKTSGTVSLETGNVDITSGTGSRTAESISAVINRNKSSVENCYTTAARTNPNLSGRIDLEIIILPNGTVSNVIVKNSTLNDRKMERCVTRSVKRWRFASGADGPVNVNLPLIF